MKHGRQLGSILLVEDNPEDVDLTLRAFRRRNIANPVDVARDGEEAVAWIPRWRDGAPRPAVILLDLKLPKLSGLEILRRLKADPVARSIPVVVLTSSKEDGDIREAYELGVSSYIVKPVDFEKFLDAVVQIGNYWCVLNRAP